MSAGLEVLVVSGQAAALIAKPANTVNTMLDLFIAILLCFMNRHFHEQSMVSRHWPGGWMQSGELYLAVR
jgi:hypothetical protein